ncbi:MAG: hypothetical protein NTW19_12535 [Planctomycetota bacterium]|nr:hypothetical protein [Planctomycetota bacterium]
MARLKAVPSPLDDQRGGTTLEWAMLLLWIVLASYVLIRLSLYIITGHFGMVTTVNSLPFP